MLASVAGGGNGMVDSPTHFAERVNNNDPTLLVEMKYERQRLATYSNWPRDVVNISPEALAQAGLFYLGLADRVKCPFCGGILCNWEPSDEPMREHLRNFPNCTFVRDARAAGNVAIGEEPTLTQTLVSSLFIYFSHTLVGVHQYITLSMHSNSRCDDAILPMVN